MDLNHNLTDYPQLREITDYPRLTKFIRSLTDNIQLASFTFPVPSFDPLACLEIQGYQSDFQFYWEIPEQQFALSGGGELTRITASGSGRFAEIAAKFQEIKSRSREFSSFSHSLSGIQLLGGFSFDDKATKSYWKSFQSSSFTVPEWLLIRNGKLGLLTLNLDPARYPDKEAILEELQDRIHQFKQIFELDAENIIDRKAEPHQVSVTIDGNNTQRNQWIDNVKRAKKHIGDNRFKKIVLTRKQEIPLPDSPQPTVMLHHLRTRYPSCFSFLIRQDRETAFLGCSPERLVSFQHKYLLTEGLAGSITRGSTASEDSFYEQQLLNSSKDRSEHQFVVDAIIQRLQPFSTRIEKSDFPTVRKLHNVQHLLTPVTAWLKENIDRLSILEQLHPTPAVGGYPRDEALSCLRELESFDRGWYAGPVGWLNLSGGGNFTVGIRSGLLHKDGINLYAGCGIVEDSDPEKEWMETNLKLSPMISALRYAGIDTRE